MFLLAEAATVQSVDGKLNLLFLLVIGAIIAAVAFYGMDAVWKWYADLARQAKEFKEAVVNRRASAAPLMFEPPQSGSVAARAERIISEHARASGSIPRSEYDAAAVRLLEAIVGDLSTMTMSKSNGIYRIEYSSNQPKSTVEGV